VYFSWIKTDRIIPISFFLHTVLQRLENKAYQQVAAVVTAEDPAASGDVNQCIHRLITKRILSKRSCKITLSWHKKLLHFYLVYELEMKL
jgi:hypothetical protein